jgi:HK97 family phage major capsid protein
VQNTDATTNSVTANVTTIAGQQVVAQQLLDQSPINMDEILLADLAADYAVKLDTFVINNNATNKVGLLNVSGLNAVTYTDATPTVGELYPKVADAIQQIHTGRFLPPDKIFMHPRRWAWFTRPLDTAGRPLVVPAANMPQNVLAAMGDVASEGFVGTLQGLPVYVDPNIPTNLGAGTNEDRIIILRSTDVILFEGTPQAEAFRETKADQLSVLLRFYNYAALHAGAVPEVHLGHLRHRPDHPDVLRAPAPDG